MKTKKRVLAILMLALLIAFSHFLLPQESSAQSKKEKISIRLTHMFPATHFVHTAQLSRYIQKLQGLGKDKYDLQFVLYPTGTLIPADQMADGIINGITDIGVSAFSYTPGRFPVMQTLIQPGVTWAKDCNAAARGAWEFFNTLKPKELSEMKVLYIYSPGPGYLHTKRPIRSLKELKGLKVRSTGTAIEAVRMLGAEPISMAMPEVYEAVQKGVLDAVISPAETLEGWKHHELFDYSIFMPYVYLDVHYVCMNLKKWQSLPDDVKAIFDSITKEAVIEAGQIWQYYQDHAIKYAQSQPGGHKVSHFPDAEIKQLEKTLEPLKKKYISTLNGLGLNGEQIVNTAHKIMEKYNRMQYPKWTP